MPPSDPGDCAGNPRIFDSWMHFESAPLMRQIGFLSSFFECFPSFIFFLQSVFLFGEVSFFTFFSFSLIFFFLFVIFFYIFKYISFFRKF